MSWDWLTPACLLPPIVIPILLFQNIFLLEINQNYNVLKEYQETPGKASRSPHLKNSGAIHTPFFVLLVLGDDGHNLDLSYQIPKNIDVVCYYISRSVIKSQFCHKGQQESIT